jgi:N utilization substance protein B
MFFNDQDCTDIIDQFKDEHKNKKVDFYSFTLSLKSIEKNKDSIKDVLDDLGVKESNMDLMDKAILYFALNEMIYGTLDKPVVIDEALRLSKKFSNPDSYKFINANLDKFLKQKK